MLWSGFGTTQGGHSGLLENFPLHLGVPEGNLIFESCGLQLIEGPWAGQERKQVGPGQENSSQCKLYLSECLSQGRMSESHYWRVKNTESQSQKSIFKAVTREQSVLLVCPMEVVRYYWKLQELIYMETSPSFPEWSFILSLTAKHSISL